MNTTESLVKQGYVVNFPRIGAVTLEAFIAAGISRAVYECDYCTTDPVTGVVTDYVVKYSTDYKQINLFEFMVYRHSLCTGMDMWYPCFLDVMSCGSFLLVEKCQTAEEAHKEDAMNYAMERLEEEFSYDPEDMQWEEYIDWHDDSLQEYCDDHNATCLDDSGIPFELQEDMHDGNWGYTRTDQRPVIIDMGYTKDSLLQIASAVGMNNEECTELSDELELELIGEM